MVAGDAGHELVVGNRIAIAEHHGGNLSIDQRRRNDSGGVPADFDVLARRVKDLDHGRIGHQRKEGSEIDARRERIDHERLLGARQLRDAELRVIGRFAQELGIDRHERVTGEAFAGIGEFRSGGDRLHYRNRLKPRADEFLVPDACRWFLPLPPVRNGTADSSRIGR